MTRTTIHLTEAQLKWLAKEAKQLGLGVAELLRRIIDDVRGVK